MITLRAISSMATRQLYTELADAIHQQLGITFELTAVGGVEAARRVQAGEPFDLVCLAADAIDKLIHSGDVQPGSRVDVARSAVAVAVRQGAPRPMMACGDDLKQAVLAAPSIGYSTGPSGAALAQRFEAWGIMDAIRSRIAVPPPGVPVAQWVADGTVALGFQQLSEMLHVPGIDVVGTLPPDIDIVTVFSGAVPTASAHPDAARALLGFLASQATAHTKIAQGMQPA